jgi:hypothetical protein
MWDCTGQAFSFMLVTQKLKFSLLSTSGTPFLVIPHNSRVTGPIGYMDMKDKFQYY